MEDEYVDYEEIIEESPHKGKEEQFKDKFQAMMNDEDFQRTFMRLHTPLNATKLPGRNEICPYCSSGKKFKHCSCYKTHTVEYRNKYFKD